MCVWIWSAVCVCVCILSTHKTQTHIWWWILYIISNYIYIYIYSLVAQYERYTRWIGCSSTWESVSHSNSAHIPHQIHLRSLQIKTHLPSSSRQHSFITPFVYTNNSNMFFSVSVAVAVDADAGDICMDTGLGKQQKKNSSKVFWRVLTASYMCSPQYWLNFVVIIFFSDKDECGFHYELKNKHTINRMHSLKISTQINNTYDKSYLGICMFCSSNLENLEKFG